MPIQSIGINQHFIKKTLRPSAQNSAYSALKIYDGNVNRYNLRRLPNGSATRSPPKVHANADATIVALLASPLINPQILKLAD